MVASGGTLDPEVRWRPVSIPFIAGQWSLHEAVRAQLLARIKVSIPFIAGQWSLHDAAAVAAVINGMSQSPSLRGSGRFGSNATCSGNRPGCLNPLHCGAVVASDVPPCCGIGGTLRVSIPFIAGQWSLRMTKAEADAEALAFQSPSLRGSGRFF